MLSSVSKIGNRIGPCGHHATQAKGTAKGNRTLRCDYHLIECSERDEFVVYVGK
jgi:hypothetical protein